jgi:hypothetical protein
MRGMILRILFSVFCIFGRFVAPSFYRMKLIYRLLCASVSGAQQRELWPVDFALK